jgi:hypothetical protein
MKSEFRQDGRRMKMFLSNGVFIINSFGILNPGNSERDRVDMECVVEPQPLSHL